MKICVMGYSGSGKSTLTRKLKEVYRIPGLHLDTVQFLPNWEVRPTAEAQQIVRRYLREEAEWVIDGNYAQFEQAERVQQADQIIFLLFSRMSCLKRVLFRYLRYHGRSRPDMTEGCAEKLDWEFIWWVLYKMRTKEKRLARQAIAEKYPEKIVVLKNQRELDLFVARLPQKKA